MNTSKDYTTIDLQLSKLDNCVGNYTTLNDFSNKVCVPDKIEDLNMHVFNMIAGKRESKTLTKDISYDVNVDGKNIKQCKKMQFR